MMKLIIIFLLVLPLSGYAHPGIAIVIDSKGNIFYSDLHQVWKISGGVKTIAVPNVHTHELYIDQNDNLYGENLTYAGEATNTFYHYFWVLNPDGVLDTVINSRQAYIKNDFSFARDNYGNEYFIELADTTHIIERNREGIETIFATGSFGDIIWLHPQNDGSILYVQKSNIYRLDANGNQQTIALNISDKRSDHKFYGNNETIWSAWKDKYENIYAASFSDRSIFIIDTAGTITTFYTSEGNWAPTHGVFDDKDQLWVLEYSDKNEVRVVLANTSTIPATKNKTFTFFPLLITGIITFGIILIYRNLRRKAIH